jgi:HlyD family secretion protein
MDKFNLGIAHHHSDEVNEIIGQAPSALLKYGITSFLFMLVIFITLSWTIRYPDIIAGMGTLYSVNTPKPVTARTTGRLARLLVKEGDIISSNEPLGLIKNTSDYEEVERLSQDVKKWWNAVQKEAWGEIEIIPGNYKNLGELQTSFQPFYSSYIQAKSIIFSGMYMAKRKIIRQDIINNDSLRKVLVQQKNIYEKDYSIADSDYQSKHYLFVEKVIAKSELKQEESKLLAKKIPLEAITSSLLNNTSANMAKEKEFMDLDKQYYEIRNNFIQSLNNLFSAIEYWKQQYVLTSSIGGVVSFSELIQENQEVSSGQNIFFIESPISSCYAQIKVDQNNFGKLALHQHAIIKLPSYPAQEYGSLEGIVTYISRIPNKEMQYVVKVELPKGLLTNRGILLNFTNELQANGEIITKQDRLLTRFMHSLQGMFKKESDK